MDFSVVIPTYNRRDVLRRALVLYDRQESMAGRFEAIVVDDGSSDGTAAMIEALRPALSYPLRFFRLPRNAGPSAARNRAIAAAGGDVLLITGDDVLPERGLLREHEEWHAVRHPEAHVGVLGRVRWADELQPTPLLRWLGERGAQFGYGMIRHGDRVGYGFLYTSNVSIKRDFLLETGEVFDERLRAYEDSEWGSRLFRRGFELRYNARAVGQHLHPVSLEASLRRVESMGRAAIALRAVNAENFGRVTRSVFDRRNRVRRWLLQALLHPVLSRHLYDPLARLCERRIGADRLFAVSHAAHFLKGLREGDVLSPSGS